MQVMLLTIKAPEKIPLQCCLLLIFCIFLLISLTNISIKANKVDRDQTAPSMSIFHNIFIYMIFQRRQKSVVME